jgi:uncharacterized coiled-coil protein SlyX
LSTETAILLEIRTLRTEQAARMEAMQRQLDLLAQRMPDIPEQLATREAARYARVSPNTLYRWRDEGRLTYHDGPRPWSRAELDQALAGAPVSRETRGRRSGRAA